MENCISVFDKITLQNEYFYRIPTLVKLNNNDLIAICDERIFSNADNPNLIHKVIRRSKDNGNTWDEKKIIIKESGDSQLNSSAAIDACLLYDDDQNIIYMIYCFTPPGIGLYNSERSVGSLNDPIVPTSYLMISKSIDYGYTWEKPKNLNPFIKNEEWGFIGACPGIGIKIKKGKYKNRLVFPIYYGGNSLQPSLMGKVIFSDDDGVTWKASNDIMDYGDRRKDGIFDSEELMITEFQIVEFDNKLIAYCRNHDSKRMVSVAESYDGGSTWENYRFININQPICQLSAITFHSKGNEFVLLSNPNDKQDRKEGTIYISKDGFNFHELKLIEKNFFSYSCMTQIDEATIGILYEDSFESIKYKKINICEEK